MLRDKAKVFKCGRQAAVALSCQQHGRRSLHAHALPACPPLICLLISQGTPCGGAMAGTCSCADGTPANTLHSR